MGIVAMYDCTNDWIPIYDKSAIPGYYMAIGTSGNQFKCSGPAGHLMAGLIDYCENGASFVLSLSAAELSLSPLFFSTSTLALVTVFLSQLCVAYRSHFMHHMH